MSLFTRLFWSMAIVFCLTLVAACAGPAIAPTGSSTAVPAATVTALSSSVETTSQTTAPSFTDTGSTRTVTLADDRTTISMRVGERFLLSLGDQLDWTVSVADPTILSRVVNVLTVRGSQGLYEARQVGDTTLSATGDPPCRKAQPPCAAPSRLFRITIIVS